MKELSVCQRIISALHSANEYLMAYGSPWIVIFFNVTSERSTNDFIEWKSMDQFDTMILNAGININLSHAHS